MKHLAFLMPLFAAAMFMIATEASAQSGMEHAVNGGTHMRQGNFQGAIEEINLAIATGGLDAAMLATSRLSRGQAYILVGEPLKGIEDLDFVIASGQMKELYLAIAYGSRGAAHRATENYEAAIADFTAAIELGAPPERLYFRRGLAHEARGAANAAAEDFREAYALNPDNDTYREKLISLGIMQPEDD
jgi:tetratricopeptide (TPR) repeat protein